MEFDPELITFIRAGIIGNLLGYLNASNEQQYDNPVPKQTSKNHKKNITILPTILE